MLLELKNIVKHFPLSQGLWKRSSEKVHAVNDVSFSVQAGETVGLVGESGCGKSTLARVITRLLRPSSGELIFDGHDITTLDEKKLQPLRRRFQMIFQDPYSSLNPRMTVGQTLTEPLKVHRIGTKKDQSDQAYEILRKVGLSEEAFDKYPHEFSGGQRQRVGIARALMLTPQLIVADEPVSALDVSIQAQIINLLRDLQGEFNLTYLLIAHDLKVVRHISHRILVMYLGCIVEEIASPELAQARHPYTQALLSAVLVPDPRLKRQKLLLSGDLPSPIHLPSGCVFHTRCPYVQEVCRREIPPLRPLKDGHRVACHLAEEIPLYPLKVSP